MSTAMLDAGAPLDAPIVITEFDRHRLEALIGLLRSRGAVDAGRLDALEEELERAEIVAPLAVPPDIITMNSSARVADLESEERLTLTVVFPGAADPDEGKVSVLAPLGLALLGARVGEELVWQTPSRRRRLRVEAIAFQPEAAGIYTL